MFHDTVEDISVLSRHDDVRWAFTEAELLSNQVYARTVGKVFGPSSPTCPTHGRAVLSVRPGRPSDGGRSRYGRRGQALGTLTLIDYRSIVSR
ncbi:MAG: hypothetical protein ACR2H3_10645 [Acidimicrobiales bacterium]